MSGLTVVMGTNIMRHLFIITILLVSVLATHAQELVTLTAPVTKPNQTTIKLDGLSIDMSPSKTITVRWLGNNNEPGIAIYSTPVPTDHPTQPTGAALLTTLNKINLSGVNPSLVARILARLQSDGYIPAGSISGTPE